MCGRARAREGNEAVESLDAVSTMHAGPFAWTCSGCCADADAVNWLQDIVVGQAVQKVDNESKEVRVITELSEKLSERCAACAGLW